MNRTRTLIVSLVVVAALLAVGTGSYSAVSADRGMNLGIASEGNGLLGITTHDQSLENDTHADIELLTVENQFGTEVTITDVEVSDDESGVPTFDGVSDGLGTIDPDPADNEVTVEADIDCDLPPGETSASETWTVTVETTGDGVSTTVQRSVVVSCG